jgi:hypothetical protein
LRNTNVRGLAAEPPTDGFDIRDETNDDAQCCGSRSEVTPILLGERAISFRFLSVGASFAYGFLLDCCHWGTASRKALAIISSNVTPIINTVVTTEDKGNAEVLTHSYLDCLGGGLSLFRLLGSGT